jgi:hypothetical protein
MRNVKKKQEEKINSHMWKWKGSEKWKRSFIYFHVEKILKIIYAIYKKPLKCLSSENQKKNPKIQNKKILSIEKLGKGSFQKKSFKVYVISYFHQWSLVLWFHPHISELYG